MSYLEVGDYLRLENLSLVSMKNESTLFRVKHMKSADMLTQKERISKALGKSLTCMKYRGWRKTKWLLIKKKKRGWEQYQKFLGRTSNQYDILRRNS